MSFSLPPILKLAERLLVDIEQAVMRFSRAHKYVFGTDLRAAAMKVVKRAQRAWRNREDQARCITRLVRAVDDLKIHLQLGMRIKAFRSFAQFEALARLAADLGRQAGGWQRQHPQHPKSPNRTPSAVCECAQMWLTVAPWWAQSPLAVAQSTAGIDVPNTEAHQRPSTDDGAFFRPDRMGNPTLWRAVCGGLTARRPSDRYVNRAPSVTLIDVGRADLTSEDRPMPTHATPLQLREDRTIARALRIIERRWIDPVISFTTTAAAKQFFTLRLAGLRREVFEVAFLNNRHGLLVAEQLFLGTVNRAEVHPREVVRRALQHNAAAVIVAHNHPSGDATPSRADHDVTDRLRAALDLVDIRLLDHIVVGGGSAYSLATEAV